MTVTSPSTPSTPGSTSPRTRKKSLKDSAALPKRVTARKSPQNAMRFVVYEDNWRRWRWRLVTHRGRVLADSNESYARQRDALEAAQSIQKSAANAGLGVQP